MKLSKNLLLASVACAVCAMPAVASADTTVTTKTVVHQKEIPNTNKTNFSAFDLNNDGILSMKEVGTKLFYVFDTDGNEVIDNIEFDHRQVMTIIPMEKDTMRFIDWDSDGNTDAATFERETFFQQSGLMRFDKNVDGLSASEFITHTMLELDKDDSKVIELDEWKEGYKKRLTRDAADQENYQQ